MGYLEESTERTGNFLVDHWRGNLSLPVSYWISGGIIAGVAGSLFSLALGAIANSLSTSVQAAANLTLIGWAAGMLIWVWAVVGVWRSADRHPNRGGSPTWATIAKAMVVIGALAMAGRGVNAFQKASETARLAAGIDNFGQPAKAVVQVDVLAIDGQLAIGSAAAVKRALASSASIITVNIRSNGGRIGEALQIAQMIKQKGLDTIAGGDCLSACTLVVLAGRHRSIAAGGRLGFHQAAFPGASAADLLQMNAVQKTTLEGAGIASGFVERALNTPSSSIWVPTEDEMFEAGFLNTVNPQRIVAEIRDVAASLNATLPKRLDNFTSLAAVNADGSTLHFRYRVSLPQGQFVTEAGKSALSRQNRLSLCNKPANARMIAAGARFAYEYLDDAAKPLFAYTVSDCR